MPKVEAPAVRLLGELMGTEPELRRMWTVSLDPREYRAVCEAAAHALGTPYGLWVDDPVGFIEVALGETLYSTQVNIAESVRDNERTVVPSAHSVGKTFLCARLVVWWVVSHAPGTAQAITTGHSWDHVRLQLWPHIRFVHETYGMPGLCLQTEWQIGDKFVASGRSPSPKNEAAFSGIHDPYVMVVIDEAGAFPPNLGRSVESIMSSGEPRLLAIGNPPFDVDVSSPWFEEQCARESVHMIRLPATASPNFTGEATPRCAVHPDLPPHPIADHLVTEKWVAEQLHELGEEHPYYVARVLAQFPRDVQGRTIPRTWLDDSATNDDPDQSDWIRLGVDVAEEGGDEFVIARAEGFVGRILHRSAGSPNANPHDLAGKVLEAIAECERLKNEQGSTRRVTVKVDATGVGWGVSGTLKAWGKEGRHNAQIIAVKVGERCGSKEGQKKYRNKKAEMWWTGRLLSQPREEGEGPTWKLDVGEDVLRQLSAPKYGHSSDGRIQIETKKEMKARGVKSPDQAEALLLAFYEPTPGQEGAIRVPGAGGFTQGGRDPFMQGRG